MPTKYDGLIDGYLRGTLSEAERQEVERLKVEDSAFGEALRFRKRTKEAFLQLEHRRLKNRLQGFAVQEENNAAPNWHSTLSRWWFAAAALVLLPVIAFLLLPKSDNLTTEELFAAYYAPYPNIVQPVVRDAEETDRRAQAYAYYEQGAYEQAYRLFGELQGAGDDDGKLPFYRAIAAMELGKLNEAIGLLSAYQTSDDTALNRQAQWYLALANLKINNRSVTAKHLKKLATNAGYKQKEAKALMAEF